MHETDIMDITADKHESALTARHDLIGVALGAVLLWVVSAALELSEHVVAFLHRWERYQVDELPGVLLFLAFALAWYAWRRAREARQQLALRHAAEGRLAESLAENRRLSLSHVAVQEAERRQLARELHDELGQHLNAIKIDAVALRNWTADRTTEMHSAALAIVDGVNHVQDTLRDLLRRLRPVGMDELGLSAALEHHVQNWRMRNAATQVTLAIEGDVDHLDENQNITCYRLVQEALTNITRHAEAATVTVRVACNAASRLELTVRDDGAGATDVHAAPGLGLIGMRERVEALGGRFEIETQAGRGFCIHASFPASAPAQAQ